MKRDLVSEYLYVLEEDILGDYCDLKEGQADKPFFIPEKEELLRYAEDGYFEETRESAALRDYLKNVMKMKRVDEIMEKLIFMIRLGDGDMDSALETLQRFGKKPPFATQKQAMEFVNLYTQLSNHTRMHCNRGFTPSELAIQMGLPPEPVSFGRKP